MTATSLTTEKTERRLKESIGFLEKFTKNFPVLSKTIEILKQTDLSTKDKIKQVSEMAKGNTLGPAIMAALTGNFQIARMLFSKFKEESVNREKKSPEETKEGPEKKPLSPSPNKP